MLTNQVLWAPASRLIGRDAVAIGGLTAQGQSLGCFAIFALDFALVFVRHLVGLALFFASFTATDIVHHTGWSGGIFSLLMECLLIVGSFRASANRETISGTLVNRNRLSRIFMHRLWGHLWAWELSTLPWPPDRFSEP